MLNGFYHIKASVLVTSAIIVFVISYGLYYLLNEELQEQLSGASNDKRVNDSTSIVDTGGNNSFAFIDTEGKNSSTLIDKGENTSSAIINKYVNTSAENIDPKVGNNSSTMDPNILSKIIDQMGNKSSEERDSSENETSINPEVHKSSEVHNKEVNESAEDINNGGNKTSEVINKGGKEIIEGMDSAKNETTTISPEVIKSSEILDTEKNTTVMPTDLSTIEVIPTVFQHNISVSIPLAFDARNKWINCPSIGKVWDQGSCSSCWAISAASVMTDRLCIKSEAKIQTVLSPQYLISSCVNCTANNGGNGCAGGDSEDAFQFWISNGLVSGGDYNSTNNCLPYLFEPCIHMDNPEASDFNHKPHCKKQVKSPEINDTCFKSGKKFSEEPKYYGETMYYISNVSAIQENILLKGPVQAKFYFDEKFTAFTGGGLYECKNETNKNLHSVKIIGWNVTEANVSYWLCVNSFNSDWGDEGLFRIRRGDNVCGIENAVLAGDVRTT